MFASVFVRLPAFADFSSSMALDMALDARDFEEILGSDFPRKAVSEHSR
jgi:hypothetical protein